MSFPSPYNPTFLHLFVDTTSTLLGTGNAQTFFQLCQNSCINTFTMYEIPTVTNGANQLNLRNFICEAKTNQGICSVAGVINPYNWTPPPQGTSYVQNIINYNNNYAQNDCEKINYLTIESEFWNIENSAINPKIDNGSSISIVQNNSFGTVTGSLAGILPGMIIRVLTPSGYVYRQIISVIGQVVTFDRVFDTNLSYTNLPFVVIDNRNFTALDFETLLYRIKNFIRPMAIANNLLPLELYVAIGRIPGPIDLTTADQFKRIIPYVDRLLIEPSYDQYDYARYNDSSTLPFISTQQYTMREALSACSVTRQGSISIALNSNQLIGTGTQFTTDLGEKTKIIVNGNQIYTIDTIVSDTQATIVGTSSVNIVAGSTYSTYYDYMPMASIPTVRPQRRAWMTNTNLKSYVDFYRFHSQSGYSVGTDTQIGNNIPKAFNDEVSVTITAATNLVGLSIFPRSEFQSLGPIASSPYPCPSCTATTTNVINDCVVTASTTSNCLVATFTNPSCNGVCNGTISATTTYGTAPFTYSITGATTLYIDQNTTGLFEGLCEDSYTLCVTDALSNVDCYFQTINLVNTFYGSISTSLNAFCVTITGGTQPYHVYLDGIELVWDYANTTNCYPSDCSVQSIITVSDSSS